jgi:rhomboid protease GluP
VTGQDTQRPIADLPERFAGSLLAKADAAGIGAAVTEWDPPLILAALPLANARIAVLDRGGIHELETYLSRLIEARAGARLFVVVAGGSAADRAAIQAADRRAVDASRLGFYLLDPHGVLTHVCGRRFGLVAKAARDVATTAPVDSRELPARTERVRRELDEAGRFEDALKRRKPYATAGIAAACIGLYVLTEHWQDVNGPLTLLQMGANAHEKVAAGEVWRLLAHAFLHGDVRHIAFNMMGVFGFGAFFERLLGWRRFVLLYGLAAIGGGVASALRQDGLSVGASGALFGLMGAGLGLVLRSQTFLPPVFAANLRPRLVGLAVLNVAVSFMPHIDYLAHAGGGIVGFGLAASGLLTRGLRRDLGDGAEPAPPESKLVRVGALAMVALMAASIGVSLATGRPWAPAGPEESPFVLAPPGAPQPEVGVEVEVDGAVGPSMTTRLRPSRLAR